MWARAAIERSIQVGANHFLDEETRAALAHIAGNESLTEDTRRALQDLVLLQSETRDWFEHPRGKLGDYGKKIEDYTGNMKRLFEALRLKLGVNEDPRLTKEELRSLRLEE
jgi:hypothetical protein